MTRPAYPTGPTGALCDVCGVFTAEPRRPCMPDCDGVECTCTNVTCAGHDWETAEAALFDEIVAGLT